MEYFAGPSGLRRWSFWLFVLLSLCIVLAAAYQLNSTYPKSINLAMYAVIGLLGVGLIVKSFLDARFLQSQTALASQQVQILEVVDNFDDFLARAQPSLFRHHIQNLHTIAQSATEVSQDNLIELLHGRLAARNKIVELFASVLITLGLIGTILGLILMMGSLTEVMAGSEINEQFMNRLIGDEGPLADLGVAFVTTLLGAALGGVILRVLTSIVDANIMEYVAHIAELTEVYVLPYLRSTAAAQAAQAA
ncbi:MAG: MotA/TolQ/ExbB proton channel family protein [Pseudomonadota bacterium]